MISLGRHLARDRAGRDWASARKYDIVDWRGGQPFFWWAREGQWHHVYDVVLDQARVRRVACESKTATHRFFVIPTGHQWRYTFGANDLRTITALELARQRASCVFHPGKNAHGVDPRGGVRS